MVFMTATCSRWNRFIVPVCWALGLALFWLSTIQLPIDIADDNIDHSWQQSLGYFLKMRYQAGRDYLFTNGPLGYFEYTRYDPDLFWSKYAWEVTTGLVFSAVILAVGRQLSSPSSRLALGIVAVSCLAAEPQAMIGFSIVAPCVLIVRHPALWTLLILPLSGWMAVVGLAKFTFLTLATALSLLLTGYQLVCGRWWRAASPVVGLAGWLLAVWLLLGQRPGNLLSYLAGSIQLALGHSESMASAPQGRGVLLALLSAGALWSTLLGRPFRSLWTARAATSVCMLAAAHFVYWKIGCVRSDQAHMRLLFSFLLAMPFLFPIAFPERNWTARPRIALCGLAMLASAAGLRPTLDPMPWGQRVVRWLAARWDEASGIVMPLDRQRLLEERSRRQIEDRDLPRIRAEVGSLPVDLFSYEQGVVLLNRFSWRPRPVFQSYLAYTPTLLAANADFFASPQAPPFVLYKTQPIDHRFPATEDGPALLRILEDYEYVLRERSFLLLRQRKVRSPLDAPRPELGRRRLRFGEEMLLEPFAGVRTASIRIDERWWGRWRRFWFRAPCVWLHVSTGSDRDHTYRLIPSMARTEFLLDPLVTRTQDVADLMQGRPLPRVHSLRVTTDDAGLACYSSSFEVMLRGLTIGSR